jgi:DNA excision repair protein ERCC-6
VTGIPGDMAQTDRADFTLTQDEAQGLLSVTEQTASVEAAQDSDADGGLEDPPAAEKDEAAVLAELAAGTRDQDDLERDIGRQADQLLLEQADERDKKRLEKTQKSKELLEGQIAAVESRLRGFGNHATKEKWREELRNHQQRVAELERDLEQIQKRMAERHKAESGKDGETLLEEAGNKRLPGESQREFLIRTGKITPFSKMGRQLLRTSSSLGDVLLDAEEEDEAAEEAGEEEQREEPERSHRNLLAPGFEQETSTAATTPAADAESDEAMARRLQDEEFASERPAKRRRLQTRRQIRAVSAEASTPAEESDEYVPGVEEAGLADIGGSGDEKEPDDDEAEGDFPLATTPGIKRRKAKSTRTTSSAAEAEDLAGIDDGNEQVYQDRLESWVRRRRGARHRVAQQNAGEVSEHAQQQSDVKSEEIEAIDVNEVPEEKREWHMPHPTRTDAEFEGGFRIPGDIYPSLFDYQKTGVQWLWELYSQQVGGIIGDEMGLGKTIQIISFLAGLHYSGKLTKPVIVVCPATVMKQWVNEFHRWWPPLRVSILHTSGSGMLDVSREARYEDDLEMDTFSRRRTLSKGHKAAKRIVDKVSRDGHVLVTTYSGLQTYAELLIPTDWEYAVLDEGHKIRNPNTAITIYCKELRTHNRVILSGTPMQNNLTELWSLFDFVFPMRLGTLVNFRNQFEIPIKQGGYANASNLQVETAMKCAETLKDTISPYLLQRFKVDVAADLPKKSERVLFCKLTKLQRDAYEWFLASEDMKSIMAGKRQALYGVDILRKICNHPDLVEHKTLSKKTNYAYGAGNKSGKMQVVKALLEIWKRNGHKTLLFAQHRIMLDILETFVQGMEGFRYRRMDGNTSIKDRQDLVDEFNKDPDLHVFLLTTKVGGLGVNLTGADRVIIYDPDWNPSTDVQARERAWRLGQKREVEIYRLMTAGTIEEKIYHRQIFKQFLTNKILKDPKQRQTFQLRDLHDLFTLGESQDGQTETGSIFKGTEVQLSGSRGKQAEREVEQSLPTPPDDCTKERDHAAMGNITGISRQEDWRGNPDEDPVQKVDDETSSTKDDRMLSSIFARTGVQSALEHDAIINGKKTVRADPELIAREARKVAAEAALELQRAGEIARTVPAGVPTWTGTVGTSGRPESPPPRSSSALRGGRGGIRGGRGGAGPSSASILSNLASRQIGSPAASTSSRASTPTSNRTVRRRAEDQPKGKDFLVLIRDFLLAHDGKAYTQMLIDHFNRYCGTPQRTAEFKEMLKVIAELERGGRGGRGRWVLREEYKPTRA